MARTVLKPKKYYDCHDVVKTFGFKEITDFIDQDSITSNGCLVRLYNPSEYENQESKLSQNQQRIYNQLGECDIHVWW